MQHRVQNNKDCKSCPLATNADITTFIPVWICDKDGSPCDGPFAKKGATSQSMQHRRSDNDQ